mmetsp:Transcript_43448/g.114545  ORF Transcript_43448/g.114545 Transcript_43448/m.114545 type:complete len:220 (+) Transcript_43448:813-1472(+)
MDFATYSEVVMFKEPNHGVNHPRMPLVHNSGQPLGHQQTDLEGPICTKTYQCADGCSVVLRCDLGYGFNGGTPHLHVVIRDALPQRCEQGIMTDGGAAGGDVVIKDALEQRCEHGIMAAGGELRQRLHRHLPVEEAQLLVLQLSDEEVKHLLAILPLQVAHRIQGQFLKTTLPADKVRDSGGEVDDKSQHKCPIIPLVFVLVQKILECLLPFKRTGAKR